jgi:hypothetical protein
MGDEPKQKNIFRSVLTANFTTLPNAMLRDRSLSFKARGMLAMILTNAEQWEVHQGWIVEQGTEGREAIAGAMREAEAAGYAAFSEIRDGGRFLRCVWTFHDAPIPVSERTNRTRWKPCDEKPCDGKPSYGKPCHGKPCDGDPATKKDNDQKNDLEESTLPLFPDYSDVKPIKTETKPQNPATMTDPQWLEWLAKQEAYQGIDIKKEISKLDVWLTTPKGRGKQKTRARIINWLNRTDRPMETGTMTTTTTTKPKGPAL